MWFSMLTKNFIGFGQNSAHPLLYDRWIARSTITLGSCILSGINMINRREDTASGVSLL